VKRVLEKVFTPQSSVSRRRFAASDHLAAKPTTWQTARGRGYSFFVIGLGIHKTRF